jgi:threonine dehydrogenase-like Zn-dependent dehydrogenase
MRTFVMESIGETGFKDKPVPEAGPNDAIVKTTVALVCTSDTHTLKGAIGDRDDLTLGHEAVGVVESVGGAVEQFQPGDRVAVGAITPDFDDVNSQNGYPSQSGGMLGGWKFANIKDGVFAEYFHVNDADANMARIPDSIADEKAVYVTDMMSTGFMGAERANVPVGGTAVVFAQGPVGLMATVGCTLRGAGQVFAVESVDERQELARRYGASEVIDFTETDPVEALMDLTDGEGVDSAIESLGAQVTFEGCIRATRPGGTISVVGYFGEGDYVKIPREDWGVGMGGKSINTGLCPGGRLRLQRLLRLLESGRVDPTPMTTHEFGFDQVDEALRLMDTKEDGVIKPLIHFNGG